MGWFDKKSDAYVLGPDGKPRWFKLSGRLVRMWEAEKKIQRVDCRVHILDPIEKESVATWRIDEHMDRATYDRFKDQDGDIYAIITFKDGLPDMALLDRGAWTKLRREHYKTGVPVREDGSFEENYRNLRSADLAVQGAAAVTVNSLWTEFTSEFSGYMAFRNAKPEVQSDFVNRLQQRVKNISKQSNCGEVPLGSGSGALLLLIFVMSIAREKIEQVEYKVDVMESFNRLGFEMKSGMPNLGLINARLATQLLA